MIQNYICLENFVSQTALCFRVNTFDCGDAVSDWLSEVLQFSGVRLLRQQSNDTRKSKLGEKHAAGDQSRLDIIDTFLVSWLKKCNAGMDFSLIFTFLSAS